MAFQSADVQLQLLTATVKLFLKQPDTTQDMVQRVLHMATEDRYILLMQSIFLPHGLFFYSHGINTLKN